MPVFEHPTPHLTDINWHLESDHEDRTVKLIKLLQEFRGTIGCFARGETKMPSEKIHTSPDENRSKRSTLEPSHERSRAMCHKPGRTIHGELLGATWFEVKSGVFLVVLGFTSHLRISLWNGWGNWSFSNNMISYIYIIYIYTSNYKWLMNLLLIRKWETGSKMFVFFPWKTPRVPKAISPLPQKTSPGKENYSSMIVGYFVVWSPMVIPQLPRWAMRQDAWEAEAHGDWGPANQKGHSKEGDHPQLIVFLNAAMVLF